MNVTALQHRWYTLYTRRMTAAGDQIMSDVAGALIILETLPAAPPGAFRRISALLDKAERAAAAPRKEAAK